jgi:hypothetical protein
MPSVRDARVVKTIFAMEHPLAFLTLLTHEVERLSRMHVEFGLRLNVASDIRWERVAPWLFDVPGVKAYDYTKWSHKSRCTAPKNYRLTYSHTERWTDADVSEHLYANRNVAMVFDSRKHEVPPSWRTANGDLFAVIDGDVSDWRYDDPRGVIVGLAAKGDARKMDTGGFITAVSIGGKR